MTPESIQKLAQLLAELPSLGPRQATRLAFHIAGMPADEVTELAHVLEETAHLKRCIQCFRIDALEKGLCTICNNPRREQDTVAIVEKETDVLTLEKTKAFKGRYLVIGDLPKDGILNNQHKQRLSVIKDGAPLSEIVICFASTTYGDMGASIVADQLKNVCKKITRLARGIPTGGEIEFADEQTLESAIRNRR
jgi:recombination protein RecR